MPRQECLEVFTLLIADAPYRWMAMQARDIKLPAAIGQQSKDPTRGVRSAIQSALLLVLAAFVTEWVREKHTMRGSLGFPPRCSSLCAGRSEAPASKGTSVKSMIKHTMYKEQRYQMNKYSLACMHVQRLSTQTHGDVHSAFESIHTCMPLFVIVIYLSMSLIV